jgi:hypothetical protein
VPQDATLFDYLKSRAKFVDPEFPALGDRFLAGHIELCLRWLDKARSAESKAWPPSEWLTKRLTFSEFESLGVRPGGWSVENSSSRSSTGEQREVQQLKLRMLAGDEIWAFSSPPETWQMLAGRAGVALVRDGRPIGYVVTLMN